MTPRQRLVSTRTDDGLELDGLLVQPDHQPQLPVLLWIHGFGANFYFAPVANGFVPARYARLGPSRRRVSTPPLLNPELQR
jgi:hypothetical protein